MVVSNKWNAQRYVRTGISELKLLDSSKIQTNKIMTCSLVTHFTAIRWFTFDGLVLTCKYGPNSNFIQATSSIMLETHKTVSLWDGEQWLHCTHTSQIRFWSSSESLGKSLRAISICKPTMYSLQMSINCCAYNIKTTDHTKLLTETNCRLKASRHGSYNTVALLNQKPQITHFNGKYKIHNCLMW